MARSWDKGTLIRVVTHDASPLLKGSLVWREFKVGESLLPDSSPVIPSRLLHVVLSGGLLDDLKGSDLLMEVEAIASDVRNSFAFLTIGMRLSLCKKSEVSICPR